MNSTQVLAVLDVVSFILVTTDLAGEQRLNTWHDRIRKKPMPDLRDVWALPIFFLGMIWYGIHHYSDAPLNAKTYLLSLYIFSVLTIFLIVVRFADLGSSLVIATLSSIPLFIPVAIIASLIVGVLLVCFNGILVLQIILLRKWPIDGLMLALGSVIFLATRLYIIMIDH